MSHYISVQDTYAKFARYYDMLYDSFVQDIPMYLKLASCERPVLEVGCGTGRILRPLLANGCTVVGVDVSDEMLTIAAGRLLEYSERGRLQLYNHDFVIGPLGGTEPFACAFVTLYTFNYLLYRRQQISLLHNIRRCLLPPGTIVIDLFVPYVLRNPDSSGIWRPVGKYHLNGVLVTVSEMKTMLTSVIEKRLQAFACDQEAWEEKIVTLRRYVSVPEITQLLTMTGFGDIEIHLGYNSSPSLLEEDAALVPSFMVTATKTNTTINRAMSGIYVSNGHSAPQTGENGRYSSTK